MKLVDMGTKEYESLRIHVSEEAAEVPVVANKRKSDTPAATKAKKRSAIIRYFHLTDPNSDCI